MRLIPYICGILVCAAFALPANADAERSAFDQEILDVLREQGAITDAQHRELEARIQRAETPPVSAPKADPGWKFRWRDGFRLDSDDRRFKLKFGGRIQLDGAVINNSSGDIVSDDIGTEFRRARIFFEGKLFEHLIFKAQYEFSGNERDGQDDTKTNFKDLYVGLRNLPWVGTVKAGRFKEAFGLEFLASSKYTTFMERSLPTQAFAPGRSTGVGFQSTAFDQRITWAIGGFFSNTPNGASYLGNKSDYQLTGRVTGVPIYSNGGRRLLHLGLAYSHIFKGSTTESVRVLEGDGCTTGTDYNPLDCEITTFTIEVPYREVDFDARPEAHLVGNLVDTGDNPGKGVDKLGFEFAAVWDSLSVQSEFMPTWVTGTHGARDFFVWGAYVQASWFLTGEHRNYDTNSGVFKRVKLKENFSLSQGTWGALELAARYSHLDLNDNDVCGGIQNDVTLGANWYLYSNLRLMLNWVHAQRAHSRVGDGGRADIVEGRISLDF